MRWILWLGCFAVACFAQDGGGSPWSRPSSCPSQPSTNRRRRFERQPRCGRAAGAGRVRPLLTGNLTTVGADPNTSIAAGALQTSGLSSRAAMGVGISQLITDFGRTSNLRGARLRAAAQDRNTATTRAQVLLQVDQAYYNVLGADAVLQVAQARVQMQKLTPVRCRRWPPAA